MCDCDLGIYRDFNMYEFVAPPRIQHVVPPVEQSIGTRSPISPNCTSVLKHMSDPLNFLNGNVHTSHVSIDDITPHNKILRGSGLHGPERLDVFRLVLFNRLKQKKPIREIPSDYETKDDFRIETCVYWFCWGIFVSFTSMVLIARHYLPVLGHHPWIKSRTDGSLGPGPQFWIME